ncbi:hypothetical protein AB4851_20670 [Burkholderia sp. 22PA0099]|uniref:hypothetical protein n=1 Tax=Burkholderia sp. 22PA0099 TaxID=3237372 RepID=UPI0039C35B42
MTNIRSAKQLEAQLIQCIKEVALPAIPGDYTPTKQRLFLAMLAGALMDKGLVTIADELATAANMPHVRSDARQGAAA